MSSADFANKLGSDWLVVELRGDNGLWGSIDPKVAPWVADWASEGFKRGAKILVKSDIFASEGVGFC